MILDQNTLLSNAQAVTASAASTNCLDLGAPGVIPYGQIQMQRNLGSGKIPLLIQVVEDFATLTSLTVTVQTDSSDSFASPKDVISSHAVPVADLVAGYIFPVDKLPRGIVERYIRVYFTVGGSDATAGKITCGIVGAVDDQK